MLADPTGGAMNQGTLLPLSLDEDGTLQYKAIWTWILLQSGPVPYDIIIDIGAGYGVWMIFVWLCMFDAGYNVPVRGPELFGKAVRLGEKLIEAVKALFPELDVVISEGTPCTH